MMVYEKSITGGMGPGIGHGGDIPGDLDTCSFEIHSAVPVPSRGVGATERTSTMKVKTHVKAGHKPY
jgi:hypothetical protein